MPPPKTIDTDWKSQARLRALLYPGGGYFHTGRRFLGLIVAIVESSLVALFLASAAGTLYGIAETVPLLLATGFLLPLTKAVSVYHTEHLLTGAGPEPRTPALTRRTGVWIGAGALVSAAAIAVVLLPEGSNDRLIAAARTGDYDAARRALVSGAEVDAADREGMTALLLSAEGGHFDSVMLLLEAGAELDKADRQGMTPLVVAALRGHAEVFRTLANAGADIEVRGGDGVTFLMEASSIGRTDIVLSLLELGAELEARDVDGWTPLMWAAVGGHAPVVEILLEAGANPAALNNELRTALEVAEHAGQIRVVGILENAGGSLQ